jgi:hypothetical protein
MLFIKEQSYSTIGFYSPEFIRQNSNLPASDSRVRPMFTHFTIWFTVTFVSFLFIMHPKITSLIIIFN